MSQRCGRVFWMVVAMMLPLQFAWAVDECGTEAAGQDIVNCNAASYPSGVEYVNSDGVDLVFNNPLTAISNTGEGIKVVGALGAGHVGVRVERLATLTTTGNSVAYGIFVKQTGDGMAQIQMDAGEIETQAAYGLKAETTNASNTEKVEVTLRGGSIVAQNTSGIEAITGGLGDVTIQIKGGSVLAGNGIGLAPEINNASSVATVSAIMTGGAVTTASTSIGARSGVYIAHRGAGGQAIVTLQNNSQLDANGGRNAIFLFLTNNAISYDVNIEGAAAIVKGKDGIVIGGPAAGNQTSGTIDIAAGALVDGTTYGGFDAISGNNGDSTVTVAGTLKGRVSLKGGDDILTLAASAVMTDVGKLDGGSGVDTLVFNAMGGFSGTNVTNWETIQIGGSLAIDGQLDVTAGGSGLTVAGVLDLQEGETNDKVIVATDYTGGGTIKLDSVLNDGVGGGLSDKLTIAGNTSGTTTLDISNLGGTGAVTGTGDTDGILVVSVGGTSNGSFVLASPLTVGGVTYQLHKSIGGDWYLQGTLACTPLGDANHDGDVNIQDVIEIINIVLAGGAGDECADVAVGNGINIQDVIGVINLVLNN